MNISLFFSLITGNCGKSVLGAGLDRGWKIRAKKSAGAISRGQKGTGPALRERSISYRNNASRSALWRNELGHVNRLRVLNAHRRIEHPQLELSNNLADNSIRPVALGRELDTHRQCTGGTQGRGDSLGRGKLPQVETPSARLSRHGSAGVAGHTVSSSALDDCVEGARYPERLEQVTGR